MVKIKVDIEEKFRFPFNKYCLKILASLPKEDLLGLEVIRFLSCFTFPNVDEDTYASYLPSRRRGSGEIEVNVSNINKSLIPDYIFDLHFEIAALFLSEILAHEIGHHVNQIKTHGIKKNERERFAEDYARRGYLNYLKDNRKEILFSYNMGRLMFLIYPKRIRNEFKIGKMHLLKQLS